MWMTQLLPNLRLLSAALLVMALAAPAGVLADGAIALLDFKGGPDSLVLRASNGSIERVSGSAGDYVEMRCGNSRDGAEFFIGPGDTGWKIADYPLLAVTVRNDSRIARSLGLSLQADSSLLEGQVKWRKIAARSMWRYTIKPPINAGVTPQGEKVKLSGMRTKPYGGRGQSKVTKLAGGLGDFPLEQVTGIRLQVARKDCPAVFRLEGITAYGSRVLDTGEQPSFFPFVDEYGQYIHLDWEGKVKSDQELVDAANAEKSDLESHHRPADWDKWGGWQSGPTLQATGHFRVQKHKGKWWLVDPDGKLYFSHGVAAVRTGASSQPGTVTAVGGRQKYFRNLPSRDDPVLGQFYRRYSRRGDGKVLGYNFSGANMRRKYGADFAEEAAQLAHDRLNAWAYNSMGAWSDPAVMKKGGIPYAVFAGSSKRLKPSLEGSNKRRHASVPDVFAAGFRSKVLEVLKDVDWSRDDPWCLGYFFDNEPPFRGRQIGKWALQAGKGSAAKQEFRRLLQDRYGSVARLNRKWGTHYRDWDDFLATRSTPGKKRSRADLNAFLARYAEKYYSTVASVFREVAPNKLYLCNRLHIFNHESAAAAARHCDVVSYNIYQFPGWVRDFRLDADTDKPVIIGEWHFGTVGHGMFDYGVRLAHDQDERATLYVEYMKAALDNPTIVGAHWFKYKNHPLTGRFSDGANAHNGLLDIVDAPYNKVIDAAREVGRNLYDYRAKGEWSH